MKRDTVIKTMAVTIAFSLLLTGVLLAADSEIGTWILKSSSTQIQGQVTMTIEVWGTNGGRKITDVFHTPDAKEMTMTLQSAMDGIDSPVFMNGQQATMTMAMKKVDNHHWVTVMKSNGKQFETSKATISPDFNTITVENEITNNEGGGQIGKQTEVWVRK